MKTIKKARKYIPKKDTKIKEGVTLRDVLNTIKNKQNACIVILDELTDTHNVGAIVRSCVAVGVDAIVINKYHQAPINDTVIRTSANTAHLIPIVTMNINDAVRTLKENKFWVHGLDMNGDNTLWNSDLTGKIGLVVGSEENGIHTVTKKLCDFKLQIPMIKSVESLNASVSTAVVLYERLRQISI